MRPVIYFVGVITASIIGAFIVIWLALPWWASAVLGAFIGMAFGILFAPWAYPRGRR